MCGQGENLRHRASFIFVFTDDRRVPLHQRRLLVQQRTACKDYCPSFWDVCTGGVVAAGESYEEVRFLESFLC